MTSDDVFALFEAGKGLRRSLDAFEAAEGTDGS